METPLLFELAAFVLGLLFGSFLNVCISRLPQHESLWRPRSHCRSCGRMIAWYDNVPVVSWVVLRGRCRGCGERISWRYPAVEIGVGVWFALAAFRFMSARPDLIGNQLRVYAVYPLPFVIINTVSPLILSFLLIGLMVMDWQTNKLPDAFTLSGILFGFVLVCVQAAFLLPGEMDIHFDPRRNLRLASPGSFVAKGDVFMTGAEHLVLGRVLAIVVAGCLLMLIRWLYLKLRGREGLGLGDAKLLAMIAAFLGFWPAMLALLLGVVLCSAYALVLLARGKANATTRLPLGTFLCVGGLVSALAGAPLIAWYSSLL